MRVKLLNTVPGLRARPGSVVDIKPEWARDLIAGKEAIEEGQPAPAADADTRFARSLIGDSPRPIDKGAI